VFAEETFGCLVVSVGFEDSGEVELRGLFVGGDAGSPAIRATLRCATTSPSNAQPSARRDSFERGSAAAVVSWRQTCPQPMQRYRRSVISSTVGRHPNGS
jgi:hypothetical protein